jgi:hypothetical protein
MRLHPVSALPAEQHVPTNCTPVALRAARVLAILVTLAISASAQGGSAELQEKLASVKQSVAANQQKLHQYTWVETQQANLRGEDKPPQTFACQYGPDGTVQKTPLSAPPPPPSGGKFKQRIVEKKTAEMKDYMGDVKGVLAMYVPPSPQKMEAAFKAGNASFSPAGSLVNLVFKNYAQPGDQMTLAFDPASKKIQTVNVNTYLDDPKQVVTLGIKFASLPDGTNYAEQTVLDASAKELKVTTSNSNYAKR